MAGSVGARNTKCHHIKNTISFLWGNGSIHSPYKKDFWECTLFPVIIVFMFMKDWWKKLWENSGKKLSVIPYSLRNLWQKGIEKWKSILLSILGIAIFTFFAFHFWGNVWDFLKNPKPFFNEVSFKDIVIGFGTLVTIIFAFKNWKTSQENTKNQTQQVKNDKFSRQNQQFLDAVKIFDESKTLESKKGALFHLENLALSSPAHRQRVLDFLNSLNAWMREKKDEIKDADFTKWRNEKALLVSEEIVPKEAQLLSAEIPKIYENIIRKHNEEFLMLGESDEERKKFELDFSYFVFAEIDFSHFVFPQEDTKFVNCVFLGDTSFYRTKFSDKGVVYFTVSEFFGKRITFTSAEFFEGDFMYVKFFGEINFLDSKFFGKGTFFNETEFFGKKIDFSYAKFSSEYSTNFSGAKFFSTKTIFIESKFFSKESDFYKSEFSTSIEAKKMDLRNSNIEMNKVVVDFFSGEEAYDYKHDFLSCENFEKLEKAGALFSDEQKAYFEAKCKKES
jgi:hypothetical protein